MIDRPHVEFVCPQAIEPAPLLLPFAAGPVQARVLVGNPEAGDGAALVELPAGWRSAPVTSSPFELLLLDGDLRADGVELGRHGYVSAVPGEPVPALEARSDSLVFVDAIADVDRAAVIPHSEDGWTAGGLPGLTRKILRGDVDGARGFLLRIPAGWSEQRTEWHDVAEAALQLEGDLWHVRANGGAGGTMRRHCYFWRPPRVLHSPMGSDEGAMSWVYVDGRLVNHFVEEEGGPPPDATSTGVLSSGGAGERAVSSSGGAGEGADGQRLQRGLG